MRKLDMIIEAAGIKAGDHVLEIGCGWGAFAIRAVQTCGCRVTGGHCLLGSSWHPGLCAVPPLDGAYPRLSQAEHEFSFFLTTLVCRPDPE
jgi:hypothetical protein